MILGVGVDLVEVARVARAASRSPRFAARVFRDSERADAAGRADRLAARFAAKEAWLKAMGLPLFAVALTDVHVALDPEGRPRLELAGEAGRRSLARGVRASHLSLSHDGSYAVAVVVLEGGES